MSLKNHPNGYWWFATPNRKQKILPSIRPMLAVCFDWNDFTDLRILRPSGSIPVITGQGLHKPIHSPSDPRNAATSNVLFIGGYTQVFVPFVNPERPLTTFSDVGELPPTPHSAVCACFSTTPHSRKHILTTADLPSPKSGSARAWRKLNTFTAC